MLLGSDLDADNLLLLVPYFVLPVIWAANTDHRTFVRTLPAGDPALPARDRHPRARRTPQTRSASSSSSRVGFGAAGGRLLAWHAAAAQRLELQARELDANRDARAAAAVISERARIARDLHDLIAHDVSVMVVQAQAAERLALSGRDGADQAIAQVETTGRAALTETRRLLGVLRQDDEALLLDDGALDVSRLAAAARRQQIGVPEIVIVALLMIVVLVETLTAPASELGAHPSIVVVAMTISPLPLLFMRRHAIAALLGMIAILLAVHLLGADVQELFAPMVTSRRRLRAGAYADAPRTYWLGALPPRRRASGRTSRAANARAPTTTSSPRSSSSRAGSSAGSSTGAHRSPERLELQTRQLERERDELAQAAVARERARIARELHDVVAHSVSAMVIQAGAARRVLARSPAGVGGRAAHRAERRP